MKGGKSPGTDGFLTEWYKAMQDRLLPTLLKTFNWVLKNITITPSWREAMISVIPKEGKDKLDCGNYRPVSLLNNDYKLFTSILSERIELILPVLIHRDQTGPYVLCICLCILDKDRPKITLGGHNQFIYSG